MKKQNDYFTDSGKRFQRFRLSDTFIRLNIVLTVVLLVLIGVMLTSLYRGRQEDPPREEYTRPESESVNGPAQEIPTT